MTKTNRYILLAACALGVAALSTKLLAEDAATGASTPSGCSGGGMTGCPMMTPVADTTTNAVPDLLKTCPVSGDKLGEMGDPYVFAYKGQEVKLCCKGCKDKFDKTPDKYMKLIRAADKKK
jgi:YHS domain-containing protein